MLHVPSHSTVPPQAPHASPKLSGVEMLHEPSHWMTPPQLPQA